MKGLLLIIGMALVNIAQAQEVELFEPDEDNLYYQYKLTLQNNSDSSDIAGLMAFFTDSCYYKKDKYTAAVVNSKGEGVLNKLVSKEYRKNLNDNIGWEEYSIEIQIRQDQIEITFYNYSYRHNRLKRTFYPEEEGLSKGQRKRLMKKFHHNAEGGAQMILRQIENYRNGHRCFD